MIKGIVIRGNLMKKYVFGAFISVLMLSSQAFAQTTCEYLPSCEKMGFLLSEEDCYGYSTLKCPSDPTKVYCDMTVTIPCEQGLLYNNDHKGCIKGNYGTHLVADTTSSGLCDLFPDGFVSDEVSGIQTYEMLNFCASEYPTVGQLKYLFKSESGLEEAMRSSGLTAITVRDATNDNTLFYDFATKSFSPVGENAVTGGICNVESSYCNVDALKERVAVVCMGRNVSCASTTTVPKYKFNEFCVPGAYHSNTAPKCHFNGGAGQATDRLIVRHVNTATNGSSGIVLVTSLSPRYLLTRNAKSALLTTPPASIVSSAISSCASLYGLSSTSNISIPTKAEYDMIFRRLREIYDDGVDNGCNSCTKADGCKMVDKFNSKYCDAGRYPGTGTQGPTPYYLALDGWYNADPENINLDDDYSYTATSQYQYLSVMCLIPVLIGTW